ncbi:hypothetical protein BS50DRAFT_480951, partial [Corynespora cassiicola Philippines]
ELEYKHRHTFIGTASLEDFLGLLEIPSKHNTNKNSVAKAFVKLSSKEQLLACEASLAPEGWEFVHRTTTDMGSNYGNYILQERVKLGSISLKAFLELIMWDGDDADVLVVISAFQVTSMMDCKIEQSGGKAKHFRSWLAQSHSNSDIN